MSNIIPSFALDREFAVFLIAALLFGSIFWIWKCHQKKRYGGADWEEYEVEESESVVSLADKVNVNWKVLAKTNNLKAPYLFEAGRIILVPEGFGNIEKKQSREISLDKSEGNICEKKEDKTVVGIKEIERADTFAAKMRNVQSIPEINKGNNYFLKFTIIVLVIISVGIVTFLIFNKNFFNIEIGVLKKTEQKKNIVQIVNEFSANKQVENEEKIEGDIAETENIKIENEKEQQAEEKDFKIVVLNGGAVSGMAGKAKTILENAGKKVADARNAQERNYSGNNIYFISEAKEEAKSMKELLDKKGFSCNMEESDKFKQEGEIVILLGK